MIETAMNANQSKTDSALTRPQGWPPIHEAEPNPIESILPGEDGQVAETGTTIVGLTTDDAVVLAADRRASVGGRLVTNKDTRKVEQIHPTAAAALSGTVGHLQHFTRLLRAEAQLYENRRDEQLTTHALATLAGNVLRSAPLGVTPVLGGVDADGAHVYTLDGGGGVLADDYAAGGSGIQLAYGVLEQHYEASMESSEGRAIAARAIDSASERDTASGNGLTVATITSDGVEVADYGDASEATDSDDAPEVA